MIVGTEAIINLGGREVIFQLEESISRGSGREADLVAACESWLEATDPTGYKDAMQRKADYYTEEEDGEEYVLIVEWWHEGLFEIMCQYAPEGYYFGSSEGNSSDYAFWPIGEED